MVKRKETAHSSQAPAGAVVDASGVVQAGRTDLDLLQAGQIDVGEYLRRHAEGATAHLVGRVSEERLADLRELLVAQALGDPNLTEIITRLREVGAERDTPA